MKDLISQSEELKEQQLWESRELVLGYPVDWWYKLKEKENPMEKRIKIFSEYGVRWRVSFGHRMTEVVHPGRYWMIVYYNRLIDGKWRTRSQHFRYSS
jgi:hypothetical protein